jgi:putative transposase
MPSGLVRLQQTGHSHFVTFTCYRRSKNMCEAAVCAVVLQCLEHARLRYRMCVYGYVLMPEHVHLLVSEPERGTLAQALQSLKSASARVARRGSPAPAPRFWQTRYYDRYMRDHEEFVEKLRYIHRNPVKRGLCESPEQWPWSSFRHYLTAERGPVEIESEWTAMRRLGREPKPMHASAE